MTDHLVEYRTRIRTRDDSADLLVVTSVQAGTNPYIKEPPRGDGAGFNPMTADQMAGSYVTLIVDAITSGTDRVVTAKLEDVNALLQLGYLKTWIEWRLDGGSWQVLTVGYLVLLRLIDAITWELTVQDALQALDGVQLFSPDDTRSITDVLADFPNRGCLYGGPVLGSFLKLKDLGGWVMRVRAGSASSAVPSRTYWLDPITVYGPGPGLKAWTPRGSFDDIYVDTINDGVTKLIGTSGRPSFLTVPFATVADAMATRPWPGLVVLIDRGLGAGFEPWRPLQPGYAGAIDDPANVGEDIVLKNRTQSGVFVLRDGQTALTLNSVVKVRCLTVQPTPTCPIYLDRHPIDLLSDLCALAGIGFDDAGDVKSVFGSGLRESIRITGQTSMGDLLRGAVFDLGIGVRMNSDGNVQPFAMRKLSNSPPTKTITDAIVVDGGVHTPFEQDVSQGGLQRVTFRHKVQVVLADAPDAVVEADAVFTEYNDDPNPMLSGTVEIQVPGMLRVSPEASEGVGQEWVGGFANELFERFGEASPGAEADLLRGSGSTDADTVVLGEEVLVGYAQLPNHNKRLGDDGSVAARAMQITQLTEAPERRTVKLSDSGPNAQPLPTKPTHTIVASADLPRTVAEVTITNAATLNGLGYALRLQMAVVAAGAGAPATSVYSDVHFYAEAGIPTTAIRLPGVTAGTKVYVRARSELSGHRPTDWSIGVGVALSAVDDPTSLAAAAVSGDGSLEDLSWVIGTNAGADVTDILVRAFGAALSTATRVVTLLAGSTRFRLHGLTPGAHYTATVQHREAATGDLSDPVDVSFVTDAGVTTLAAPTGAIGFADGSDGDAVPVLTGLYGMACVAVEFPSSVEFQEALETAPASDSYGAFATTGIVPSVSGDFTVYRNVAPSDGLRRKLRARHIRDGTTPSGFTVPVVVTPWTFDPLVVEEDAISLNDFKWTDSADQLTRTFTMFAGRKVHRVTAYLRTMLAPPSADPWPPADDATALAAWLVAGGVLTPLTPDPTTGLVTFAVAKPNVGAQSFVQFEPRLDDWSAGPVRRSIVDPASSAMTGTIKGAVTNGTVDLSANVQASLADWPVQVDFYADDPFGAAIATKTISANATLDKTTTGLSALGGLTLPLREVRRFFGKLTNVAGEVVWMNPIAVDRDSVPYGYVTVTDYRAAPTIRVNYDDDTNTVIFHMPGARTKTFSGLSGSGSVAYTVGDAIDGGGAVESALAYEEARSGYYVEVVGGGVTSTIWGASAVGVLHGPVLSAIAQGTVSIEANGSWSWSVDGPSAQDHVKYAESTSAFPSDASAAAGTTLASPTGRQVTRTGGTALTFGQTIFITLISYDAAGNALQSIRLRGSYQTYSASKTTTYGPFGWIVNPASSVVSYTYGVNGWINNAAIGTTPVGFTDINLWAVLPSGVTISQVALDVIDNASGLATANGFSFNAQRLSGTTLTSLGNTVDAANGGAQTLTLSLSETTSVTRTYLFTVEFTIGTSGHQALAGQLQMGNMYITYTPPTPDKNV